MKIPHTHLSADALRGVLEEFVTRDGTNLGDAEMKIEQVMRQLDRGEVAIAFDEESETCNIVHVQEDASKRQSYDDDE